VLVILTITFSQREFVILGIHSSGLILEHFRGNFGEAVLNAVHGNPNAYVYLATLDGAYHPHDIRRACEYQVQHGGSRADFLLAFLENAIPVIHASTMTDILARIGTGDEFEVWFPNFSAFSFHTRQPTLSNKIQLATVAFPEMWASRHRGPTPPLEPEDVREWMRANECFKIVAYGEIVGVVQFSNGDTGVSHER
jgi:hypothetical protein